MTAFQYNPSSDYSYHLFYKISEISVRNDIRRHDINIFAERTTQFHVSHIPAKTGKINSVFHFDHTDGTEDSHIGHSGQR